MPPRIAVAGIVAFWLATTGYIAYRDVWPRVFASGPPPVSIELADEARQNVPAKWALYRNRKPGDKPIGRLTTQMKYLDADDAFQFTYRYSDLKFEQGDVTLAASEVVSEVKMTRAGELREQSMTGKVKLSIRGAEVLDGTIAVRGSVTNGVLTGRCELKSNLLGDIAEDLDPIPVPKNGQPLNPLQPVNRIGGVRGGLSWEVDESNPLQDAVLDLFKKKFRLPEQKQKKTLVAQVDREQQTLTVNGAEVSCWVIEYRRAEPVARTWVRATDGKVLRQEAFEKGESLTFERED
jgi:hypothetical protein